MQTIAEKLHQLDYFYQIFCKNDTSSIPQQYFIRMRKLQLIKLIGVEVFYKKYKISFKKRKELWAFSMKYR